MRAAVRHGGMDRVCGGVVEVVVVDLNGAVADFADGAVAAVVPMSGGVALHEPIVGVG